MKILHFLANINTGGAEKFCVDLCNTQADVSENKIFLCVLESITEDQPLAKDVSSKVKLISLHKQSGYSLKIIYKIYKLLTEIKPDIIHLNGRTLIYSSIAILLKKIPSVYTVHTMADKEYNQHLQNYVKLLFNKFSKIFTPVSISQSVSETVKKIYGVHLDTVIYNGSSELKISSEEKAISKSINELKMNDQTLVFMYIGRIQKIKNTLLLIQAFNKLLDNDENILLCIIGYDPVSTKSYYKQCYNKNRYPEKIKFLGRKENIADYLLNTDAMCLTSTYEGLGIAVLEAFSLGVPVLSTPSGGPSEIIISGINGYLSEQISVESYVKVLKKFIEEPLRNREKIMELYQEKYTMKACALQYLKLYEVKRWKRDHFK